MARRSAFFGAMIAAAVLCACQSAAPADRENSRLVGVWQLVRYDNVAPADAPPELRNMLIVYRADGFSNVADPDMPGGRAAEDHYVYDPASHLLDRFRVALERAYGSQWVPYRLQGSRLTVWDGLVNDYETPKTIEFQNDDEHRLIYADGSIAYFRRLSSDAMAYQRPPYECVTLTIRGRSGIPYDEAATQAALERFRHSDPAATEQLAAVEGRWISDAPYQGSFYQVFVLEAAGKFSSYMTRDASGQQRVMRDDKKGLYWLRDSLIKLQAGNCGDWLGYTVNAEHLVIESPYKSISFKRLQ